MMDTRHYKFVQTHGGFNAKSETLDDNDTSM